MVDATPQYLDPALGVTPPRPPGLRRGDYPRQATARALRWWTIGVSTRAIRPSVGETVGQPLHYEYDVCPYALVAIVCYGDPDHPDDQSVAQIAQDNPPQGGRVFAPWFWYDWRHSTASVNAAFNRNLATKSANACLGPPNRPGSDRRALAVTALAANGGTALSAVTDLQLITPGNVTKEGLECPLMSDDGSFPSPQPLRVPCWVGRTGFRGFACQVLAGGATTQNFGPFLRLKPVSPGFIENAPALKLEFANASGEYGCEAFAACAYTLARIEPATMFSDPDFTRPAPYPCKPYAERCWKSSEQTAYAQVFLTPLGDLWFAILAIHHVGMERTAGPGRFVTYYNFTPIFSVEKGSVTFTRPADDISQTVIHLGTTTVARSILGGAATLTLTIVVGGTGKVTRCDLAITRHVTVTNLGPGWHDSFARK